MGLGNWRSQQRRQQRKMSPRYQQQQRRCRMRKQKRQRVWVNFSNGGGASVFIGLGYWWQRRRRQQSKTGKRTQLRQQRRWQRTRNRQRVWGIGDNNWGVKDSGMTTEAAASRWRAWGIGDHDGYFSRGRWAQGIDDNNGGVGWGSRRDNASKWTSPTAEAPVCLQDQDIYDDDDRVSRVRRARRLRDDNGGIGRGRGIDDASEVLETTTKATGDRRQAQVIYDNGGGVCGEIWARRLKQQQQRRRRRIDDVSKILETTTKAAADRRCTRLIGNDNEHCLFSVSLLSSFGIVFIRLLFFHFKKYYQNCNRVEIFLYQVYTNLAYVSPTYGRVKNYEFSL